MDGQESGRGFDGETAQLDVELVELSGEEPVALGEAAEGKLGGRCRGGDRSRTEPGGEGDEGVVAEVAEALAKVGGSGEDQGVHLVGDLGAHLHRGASGDPK